MKEILGQLSELQELKKAFIDLKQQSDKTAEVVIAQKEKSRSRSRSRKEHQDETSQETSLKSHGPEFEKSLEDSKDSKKSKTQKPSKEDKKESKKSSKAKDKQERQDTNTSGGVESSQDKLSNRNKPSILKNPKHDTQPIKVGKSKELKPTQKSINTPNDVYKQMNEMAHKNYKRGKLPSWH